MKSGRWQVYDFPFSPRFIPLGQLDDQIWFTFAVVTASENSAPAIPQQWIYVQIWQRPQEQAARGGAGPLCSELPDSRAGRLLRRREGRPMLTRLAKSPIHCRRKAAGL